MEENDRIREALLASVSSIDDTQLNERLDSSSWSIMEVLEHLSLIEMVVANAITEEVKNEQSVRAEDKPIKFTVDRRHKVKAPGFIEPSGEFLTLEEVIKKLAKSREALVNAVANVEESVLEQKSYPHPVFGPLSLKQWVPFVGLHEKRHLEQIEEIKAKLGIEIK
ncbi:DinB family protein [Cytobacillus suaedae]|nr:DinB family protein [Cytobacillus suaedae]